MAVDTKPRTETEPTAAELAELEEIETEGAVLQTVLEQIQALLAVATVANREAAEALYDANKSGMSSADRITIMGLLMATETEIERTTLEAYANGEMLTALHGMFKDGQYHADLDAIKALLAKHNARSFVVRWEPDNGISHVHADIKSSSTVASVRTGVAVPSRPRTGDNQSTEKGQMYDLVLDGKVVMAGNRKTLMASQYAPESTQKAVQTGNINGKTWIVFVEYVGTKGIIVRPKT